MVHLQLAVIDLPNKRTSLQGYKLPYLLRLRFPPEGSIQFTKYIEKADGVILGCGYFTAMNGNYLA
jgi:hypothetical protein